MQPEIDPLEAALAALREPGAMRRTPPAPAQAARLEARLAARAGQDALAADRFQEAERGERATFAELGAVPWLARTERISLDLQRAR